MNGTRPYKILLGVLIGLFMITMYFAPQEVKWLESFSNKDKIPFGSFVLYDLLPALFPQADVIDVEEEMYYVFSEQEEIFEKKSAYIIINDILQADEYDINEMLAYVSMGNSVLIAARDFPYALLDTFGIRTQLDFISKKDSVEAGFLNPDLQHRRGYDFRKSNSATYFKDVDTSSVEVIALNNEKRPAVIRIAFGQGQLILCSAPRMFTNFHVTGEKNYEFLETVFSYVPVDTELVLWDEYYKKLRLERLNEDQSILRFITQTKALNWAWWLVVIAGLVYVAFEVKRKQRIIPIIEPLPNSTLEFTETVGRLYFQSKDHKNLAEKKIRVLLAYIRSRYFLKTHRFDREFINSLASKSTIPVDDIRILCNTIHAIQRKTHITENELIDLNIMIEAFYEHGAR
ncbi:MAG: DUF4350 domain-containing protein [Bacteroidota bacterium]